MGQTVCEAVQGAADMELVARADPALDTSVGEALRAGPEVLVDFTVPAPRSPTRAQAVDAGVHVVIGTTGFDLARARCASAGRTANVFVAPNFAIGAVLMMQFAAEAAKHMQRGRDHRAPSRRARSTSRAAPRRGPRS